MKLSFFDDWKKVIMQYLLCFWLLHFQLDDLLDSFHLYDLDPYNLRSLPFNLQNDYKRQKYRNLVVHNFTKWK